MSTFSTPTPCHCSLYNNRNNSRSKKDTPHKLTSPPSRKHTKSGKYGVLRASHIMFGICFIYWCKYVIISGDKKIIYHDVTSSSANKTPPTGALKAAATPAAQPHVTFSKYDMEKNKDDSINKLQKVRTVTLPKTIILSSKETGKIPSKVG